MKTLSSFSWPAPFRAAVSLTFDDARVSQIDHGFRILNRHDVKASGYVTIGAVRERLDAWKSAITAGHEVGNHTVSHPCSANYAWSRGRALEDYSLEQIEGELLQANVLIEELLGVKPITFAYPCGQKFVGRGQAVRSYVPLVARHFLAGRGFNDEHPISPGYCDLAQINGVSFDCLSFDRVQRMIELTCDQGGWLCLVGHDVGDDGVQTVLSQTLDDLCAYCTNPANRIWIDRVDCIAAYITKSRNS